MGHYDSDYEYEEELSRAGHLRPPRDLRHFQELAAKLASTKRRAGFFDLPGYAKCHNPEHDFPTMLYIPPGKGYTHVCPSCGKSTTVTNPRFGEPELK